MGLAAGHQTTLRQCATLTGSGVHSNAPVTVTLHPAEPHAGVVFLRTGLEGGKSRSISARWSEVTRTELCTVIGDSARASVSTIEHLLAAFAGLGVDNVLVEIDGPEAPIMDGSARDFVDVIDQAGLIAQAARRRYLKVLKPVRVEQGRAFSELLPSAAGFKLDVEIDFASPLIGRQRRVTELDAVRFRSDIAGARTFGFVSQVEQLWKMGFALGSSLENSVALDDERILNPEGLRYPDEFVRHKTLDAVGDLALAGAPIIGTYRSYCGGHRMNVAVLEALFASRANYAFVEAGSAAARRPLRTSIGVAAAQPAFAPEMR